MDQSKCTGSNDTARAAGSRLAGWGLARRTAVGADVTADFVGVLVCVGLGFGAVVGIDVDVDADAWRVAAGLLTVVGFTAGLLGDGGVDAVECETAVGVLALAGRVAATGFGEGVALLWIF